MKRLCQRPVFLGICLFIGLAILCLSPLSHAEEPASLQEGIEQYKQENYEEAAEILKQVRQQDPKSAMAAFFLGLSHKQMGDNDGARQQFEDAVTLDPPVKDAVVELIDVLNRTGKYDQAFKWIALAEKEGIDPAKIAFLKGMVLARTGKYTEAIASFEKSKELDGAYRQSADMQIGLCYMGKREYRKASERFQNAVTQDPLSDLAAYARRYQDISEQRRFAERPIRFSLGVMGQYDT
ncbi:MAG: tetratricopeptide repeat protein, partial [Deltaproteobacteria bacterium]|nr:tetratricopeptide repeat protein [Deltaproteobacteria bacterium]